MSLLVYKRVYDLFVLDLESDEFVECVDCGALWSLRKQTGCRKRSPRNERRAEEFYDARGRVEISSL